MNAKTQAQQLQVELRHAAGRSATTVTEHGDPARARAAGHAPGAYALRVPEVPQTLACPRCRDVFLAAGPTGYAGEEAICDRCLLEGSHLLGMVVALVAVARAFGGRQITSSEDYRSALTELGVFAQIYEQVARRYGPPRAFRLGG